MNNEQIRHRFGLVKSERTQVEQIWDYIERYISPYRGRFFKDERSEASIEWRKPWVYDATAIMSAQNLASSLHSRLTSSSSQWFGLRFSNEELNDNKEATEWLEECVAICYDFIQESNFNTEVNETYTDLVCFGSAALIEEVAKDSKGKTIGINFSAVPIKECFFEQDSKGKILNFYRHLQWTVKQIQSVFGDDVPQMIKDYMQDEGHSPDRKIDIIYCIYRDFNITYTPGDTPTSKNAMPFKSRFVLLESAEQLGEEEGFPEMPAFLPRWRTTSSSAWGNSPAMIALSDTMTLNRTIELNLSAVEKALDPAILTTSRGLIGDLDLNAGGLTTVRDVNELVPFESRARFDVTYQEMERLRQNIESYFYIPQLILPPMQGTPATATEIAVRMQQLEALIGPTLGRLQKDLLSPIVERTFYILSRNGMLPETPDIVKESDTGTRIEYLSPLAKTMESSNVAAIERWVMTLANLAQVKPEVLDIPDWDAVVNELADKIGVSAKLVRASDDVETDRSEREQIQKTMAEGEAMQAMGDGMQAMNQGGNNVG